MKAVNYLTAIILVCAMALNLTSCSSDDDNTGNGQPDYAKMIVGSWTNGSATYTFDAYGTAHYEAGETYGNVSYDLQGTTIHMRCTFFNDKYHDVWKSEKTGQYSPSNDIIYLDDYKFHRVK